MVKFKNYDKFAFEWEFSIPQSRWCYLQPSVLRKLLFPLGITIENTIGQTFIPYCINGKPMVYVRGLNKSTSYEVLPMSTAHYEYIRGVLLSQPTPITDKSIAEWSDYLAILPDLMNYVQKTTILQSASWLWGVDHPLWASLHKTYASSQSYGPWVWATMARALACIEQKNKECGLSPAKD